MEKLTEDVEKLIRNGSGKNTMIETVFALILTLNGNMIEHVYKNNLSDCLKSKRIAQNEVNPERVVFSCQKVKAQTEIYMDRKKIVKIIK